MSGIRIISMGKALPHRIVENASFAKTLDTSDEWIRTRTGILSRHFCEENETAESLACSAAAMALERAESQIPHMKSKIGLVITATCTPPGAMPSISCMIQEKSELADGIPAFDINAACSGYVYALVSAISLMDALDIDYALIVGAEEMSSILDMTDRSTCVLFGDGAGAAVIGRVKDAPLIADLGSSGSDRVLAARPYITMEGKEVFRFAVTTLEYELRLLSERSGIALHDIDAIICHQANVRIIDHVRRRLDLPEEKFFINLQTTGNTSGASIPIAMNDLVESGKVTPGARAFAVGFGAGLTWGGILVTFS